MAYNGHDFEGDFIDAFRGNEKNTLTSTSSQFRPKEFERLDKEQGTDALLNVQDPKKNDGERIDFTGDFSHKDHMIVSDKTYTINVRGEDIVLRFGVRTGNDHHDFERPVLVIGTTEIPNVYLRETFFEKFRDRVDDVMDTAMDAFYDILDAMDEDKIEASAGKEGNAERGSEMEGMVSARIQDLKDSIGTDTGHTEKGQGSQKDMIGKDEEKDKVETERKDEADQTNWDRDPVC